MKLKPWQFLLFILNLKNTFPKVLSQSDLSYCGDNGNYTSSLYRQNLNSLFSSIPTNVADNGFYNESMGDEPDHITATAFCSIDQQLLECRKCIRDGAEILFRECPMSKEAILWRESCTLRYSNESFLGYVNAYPYTRRNFMWQVRDSDFVEFNNKLRILLDDVRDRAANSQLRYATANTTAPGFVTMYAAEQCRQDLSAVDCHTCLDIAAGKVPECCNGTMGADILLHSCSIRYKSLLFYNMSRVHEVEQLFAPPSPNTPSPRESSSISPSPPQPAGGGISTWKIAVGVAVPVILVVVIVPVVIICKRKSKKKPYDETTPSIAEHGDMNIEESLQFEFDRIKAATNDFSEENKIGQGGFGAVYKGMLENGKEIAVKRLFRLSPQGDSEFKNEVVLLAKLQHRNLVRLFGYSIQRTERLLIYEYFENGSLDQYIFDPVKNIDMDWDRRYKIIGGIARGLVYLHEDAHYKITHRDLKASNVLLDGEMNPKIADFGAARLLKFDETDTSRIVGTYGYMPPEYLHRGQVSVKLDVYGFGVLVLEIVSGQKHNSFNDGGNARDMLTYAWRKWQEGAAESMIDPVLMADSRSMRDIMKCIHIGLLCVQGDATKRPAMFSIVTMLNSSSITMPVPSQPGFFIQNTTEAEVAPSPSEVSVSDLVAR